MTDKINWIGNLAGRALLHPFDRFSPWVALSVASLYLALLALLAFKFCSDQAALRRRKEQALARLLELQLFKDDLLGIFGTFGRIVAAVGRYLFESFKPLVAMAIPLGLLLIQMANWLPNRPLRPGESAILTVTLDDNTLINGTNFTATASEGIEIETGPFVSAPNHQVLWRIRPHPSNAGGWVEFSINGKSLRKSVSVADSGMAFVSLQRVRDGLGARLLNPLEQSLPTVSHVRAIAIDYPARKYLLGAHNLDPLLSLFALSLGFGLVLKRPLRVEF